MLRTVLGLAAALALPVLLSACNETRDISSTDAIVNRLADGGVEVTLQGSGCVTRWNSEAAMTYASEGTGGCTDSQIAAAKTVAIANIPNL